MATIKEVIEVSVKGIYQASLNYFGLTTQMQSDKRASHAYESGTFDSLSGNDDPQSGTIAAGGFGYMRQGQRGKRTIDKTHDEILNTVWSMYQSNGIAKRALDFYYSAILGRDTQPETPDENLQIILDQFWKRNLENNHNLKRFVIAHALFGELILPVFVREADGRVLLGYIDQGDAEENGIIFHPQNNLERWAVVLKEQDGKRKCYRIIREDEGFVFGGPGTNEMVQLPRHPDKLVTWEQATLENWEIEFLREKGLTEYTGSCFYFDKNNLANQPRGFSDLLQSVDWLDVNDNVLFSLAEREELMNYFSWLVKLTSASKERVSERRAELATSPPMGKGQINIHNDAEEWTPVSFDMKQPGSIAVAGEVKKMALEGTGQPLTWHNEMDTSNRATAERADNPANRALEHEQGDLVKSLILICQFVADQAEIAGFYKPEDNNKITIQVPEIVKSDMVEVSDTFSKTVNGLTVAQFDLKVITRETSAKVVSKIIAEFGVQYNPDEELEEIDKQAKEIAMQTQDGINQFLVDTIERNGVSNDGI